ncbi:asparaginase domain-containing protein [Moraxella nasovis]|uniref:asparaginase domain-containing protein n=1 Tax=Moraxella nasovis TaxID=2904121 RepID=UPI001F61ED34|nr:asparaginase domain-containing protein [Moraxella nasovis]UNU73486.1 asparaginase domain-containing protein [Moraxella nasovis]
MKYQDNTTYIIYAGGTFGSHGVPLSPLQADIFLPTLKDTLDHTFPQLSIDILPNNCVKDSSSLTPADFVHFYELILTSYTKGARHFVLITGTDSLSYLAAFLANAFHDCMDMTLVVTGSMQPLFIPDNPVHTINADSDALANLSGALAVAQSLSHGVFVQFNGHTFFADNTQKINSQDKDAFIGTVITENNKPKPKPYHAKTWQNNRLASLNALQSQAKHTVIYPIFALPNDACVLDYQLNHLPKDTKAVIMIAFGAGNLPYNSSLADTLQSLADNDIKVICTTQCPFGGVSTDYAAGSWQYQYGVLSGHVLSIAAIFGRALWLSVNNQLNANHWQQGLN